MSAHTDRSYARDLAALEQFCDRAGVGGWQELDPQHVRSFAAHSHAAGLGPRSIQRRLSAVRSFYAYLLREEAVAAASPGAAIAAGRGVCATAAPANKVGSKTTTIVAVRRMVMPSASLQARRNKPEICSFIGSGLFRL